MKRFLYIDVIYSDMPELRPYFFELWFDYGSETAGKLLVYERARGREYLRFVSETPFDMLLLGGLRDGSLTGMQREHLQGQIMTAVNTALRRTSKASHQWSAERLRTESEPYCSTYGRYNRK